MKKAFAACAAALALLAAPIPSPAQAATAKEIVARGSVKIGVIAGSPLIGSVDETGNTVGYYPDVANYLGKLLGVKVELVPLTSPMVLVTHEMTFARRIANHVLFMQQGVVCEQGDASIVDRAATPELQQCLSSNLK